MTDLHSLLGERATLLATSLRDAPEFDAPTAKRSVRRRRITRATLVGAAAGIALIAVGGGTWALMNRNSAQPIPPASPTPSATLSATPSTTPTASPSPSVTPIAYEGRNPNMTDEEALVRAENPATGEVWLATPKLVHPGRWAKDDLWSALAGADPDWYLVGHRGGNEILSQGLQGILVEVAPDGSSRAIVAPRPDQEAKIPEHYTGDSYPIAVDISTYYDSLAVPATGTTPEGNVVNLRFDPGPWTNGPEETTPVSAYGGSSLLRGTKPVGWEIWGAEADDLLTAAGAEQVAYFVRTPYGALIPVPMLDDRNPAEWATGYGTSGDVSINPLYSTPCGVMVEYEMAIRPDTGGDWESAGSAPSGEVLAPTESNELGKALYKNWRELANGSDYAPWDAITSLEDFLHVPAVTAIRTADPDVWWLTGNSDVMTIQGC